jgi:aspartyl/glutamyl-tRNA(Asn/Gln) amidotransferase C subunit
MTKKLSNQDVQAIADLIKIHIPEKELEHYSSQLNTVLDAVEVLKEIDTDEVVETSQTHGLVNVLAEDLPEKGLDMSIYPNRKNLHNKYFVVSRVL